MKAKKEYIILVALILALSLYLFLYKSDRTLYELPKIPKIPEKEISKIEIFKTGSSILLEKKDNTWYIEPEGYLADAGKVNNMLAVIENLTVTALVSESKSYNRYGLNDEKKITVRAWAGDKLRREFEVGKTATSYRHTFVRLADDPRVYHARENFRDRFDLTADNLRDKTVLSFSQDEIQELQITKGDDSLLLRRLQATAETGGEPEPEAEAQSPTSPKTIWQSNGGEEGNESTLNSLLSTLSNLKCEKYIDDRKKEDFTKPVYTIQLKGSQEYALSIFAKTDKDATGYPAVSSESDYPFLLQARRADNIMKKPDELLKKPDNHSK
jgi:hypothetical protein